MHNSQSLQLDSNNNKKWFRKKKYGWGLPPSVWWMNYAFLRVQIQFGMEPGQGGTAVHWGWPAPSLQLCLRWHWNQPSGKYLHHENGQMLQWGLPPILTREQAGQHLPLYHWGYTKRAPQKCTQWMLVTQNQMRGRLAGSAHSAWDFQCQDPEFKPYTGQGGYLKKKKKKSNAKSHISLERSCWRHCSWNFYNSHSLRTHWPNLSIIYQKDTHSDLLLSNGQ